MSLESDSAQLLKAIDFAAKKHKNQKRKDPEGTPYINHPIGVAHILMFEAGVADIATVIGAVLHDTVEDTDTTLDEIEAIFGEKVRLIVDQVSDDKKLPSAQRKALQIEHAPHICAEAKLVKMADKIYNLRDLKRVAPAGWTRERVNEYFAWSKRVTDNLGQANGPMKAILDDIYQSYTSY